jgi:uncharacterized protein
MKTFWTTWTLLLAAGLALLAPAPSASASARGIKDNANFFSPDGEKRANAIIDDIFTRHHAKEVLVETFEALPPDTTYEQFVQQRFREARLNGVYIVVVKQGGHVSVRADSRTELLFTDDVCKSVAQRLGNGMRTLGKAPYDSALIEALQLVADTFQRGEPKAGASGAAPQRSYPGAYPPPAVNNNRGSGSWLPSGIMGWICLGVGVWIIFALVRSIFASRSGGYGGGGPGYGGMGGGPGYGGGGYGGGYGGGGGWGTSLLGGLFGAAAGSWLYDRFAHGGSSAYGAPPVDQGGYGGAGGASSTPDWAAPGDSSSGGGSAGDASFGGDAGGGSDASFGGDSGGGGDFSSGGDFGGGGDSGGGGGGDFA